MSGRFPAEEVQRAFRDRAVLVGADLDRPGWPIEEDLAELERLAHTAGAEVVSTVVQRLDRPVPRTFIGAGKAAEVADVVQATDATLVIFDDDLSPSQQANLEKTIPDVKIIDRTALILDIFALHATSREGKLQVELAQMEYLLPRLRGLWRHLERLGGGIGTRGPGESQLETDRRLARKRIANLRRDLKSVGANRALQRSSREDSGVFRIALVGYTNAGKSSLLNAMTGAGVLVEDLLFATLDSTTRRLDLPDGRSVTLTDTVGFINKLPHGLVEAFKSTLDEVREADLLIHVVDVSHTQAEAQMVAVDVVLDEIDVAITPRVLVLNKKDRLDTDAYERASRRFPDAVILSATTGEGIDRLLERLASEAARGSRTMTVLVPYTRGELVRLAHEQTHLVHESHTGDGTQLVLRVPSSLVGRFEPFAVDDGYPRKQE